MTAPILTLVSPNDVFAELLSPANIPTHVASWADVVLYIFRLSKLTDKFDGEEKNRVKVKKFKAKIKAKRG